MRCRRHPGKRGYNLAAGRETGAILAGVTRRNRMLAAVVVAFAIYVAASARAGAADRVYWSNSGGDRISYANLDGTGGGGNLNTTGAISGAGNLYFGLAIDLAAGKLYWANYNAGHPEDDAISYANLDGSGGGTLDTTGAKVEAPVGVAIDPATNRIYWANSFPGGISWANLDGSGGGDLDTSGATVSEPAGVAIDPATNRIYWTNASANKISWASLDGSGGEDLSITGPPTVNKPEGLAIDPVSGRIYWANRGAGTISWANLDGSGGEDLSTSGATTSEPTGVAVDLEGGRVYWGNFAGGVDKKISFANLDGSGGEDLNIAGAIETGAFSFPALLKAPRGTGAPSVSGGSATGSTLTCSQGSWAADAGSEFLFQSPQSYAYAWQLNGADIPGADATTLVANDPGLYSCRVSAANVAGSSAQSSAQVQVSAAASPSAPSSPSSSPPPSSPPRAEPPSLTHLAETNRVFAPVGAPKPHGKRGRHRVKLGTTFHFTLDQAATVKVEIRLLRPASRSRQTCKRSRRKPTCVLRRSGRAGANKLRFSGRLNGKALAPGRYLARFVAENGAGTSATKAIRFTVVAR
jgi:DNA-binding beta-propeller fold protein YncE